MHSQAFLVALLLALAPAHAAEPRPPSAEVPLGEARKALLAQGWTPRETFLALDDGTRESQWGDAGLLYRAGFVEVERCTGTGANYCTFNYRRGRSCLVLQTKGEFEPGRYEPAVVQRLHRCPSKEALHPENGSESTPPGEPSS